MERILGALSDKTIAVVGLAFWTETDHVGKFPGLEVVNELLLAGATVAIHHPQAMGNFKAPFDDRMGYGDSPFDAVDNADDAVVLTE